jgi:hypothetical protein
VIKRLLAVSVLALTLVSGALAARTTTSAQALPARGILTPGVSLGGIHIGDTMATVVQRWGHKYSPCPKNQCKGPSTVWYYIYGRGEPLGAAVRFNKKGRVTAVFTLGSPAGWRTAEGLLIGQQVDDATRIYGQNLKWSVCIGYGAMSMRNSKAVTSIYTTGEAIYGFAITAPGTPVCQ